MTDKAMMSLSLDLDNKWSYLRTYGDENWKNYPSYLEYVVPRILEFLDTRNIKITFFVVGKDASLDENRSAIAALAEAGHEIGSHSFMHEPWLHLYSEEDLETDLRKAEEAIEAVTGVKVNCFRGPGYSLTETTLKVLHRRGYDFDATAFPNILSPLARAYLFATTKLSKEEKRKRKALFGSFSDAFRPVKPYNWLIGGESFLELPVTTMPIFRTPIHFSYLIYLGMFSKALAKLYLRLAILMCKATGTEPSLLLHPLDFMGSDDDRDLSSFPGMKMSSTRKLELMNDFLEILTRSFVPVTMGRHIENIRACRNLKEFQPSFNN